MGTMNIIILLLLVLINIHSIFGGGEQNTFSRSKVTIQGDGSRDTLKYSVTDSGSGASTSTETILLPNNNNNGHSTPPPYTFLIPNWRFNSSIIEIINTRYDSNTLNQVSSNQLNVQDNSTLLLSNSNLNITLLNTINSSIITNNNSKLESNQLTLIDSNLNSNWTKLVIKNLNILHSNVSISNSNSPNNTDTGIYDWSYITMDNESSKLSILNSTVQLTCLIFGNNALAFFRLDSTDSSFSSGDGSDGRDLIKIIDSDISLTVPPYNIQTREALDRIPSKLLVIEMDYYSIKDTTLFFNRTNMIFDSTLAIYNSSLLFLNGIIQGDNSNLKILNSKLNIYNTTIQKMEFVLGSDDYVSLSSTKFEHSTVNLYNQTINDEETFDIYLNSSTVYLFDNSSIDLYEWHVFGIGKSSWYIGETTSLKGNFFIYGDVILYDGTIGSEYETNFMHINGNLDLSQDSTLNIVIQNQLSSSKVIVENGARIEGNIVIYINEKAIYPQLSFNILINNYSPFYNEEDDNGDIYAQMRHEIDISRATVTFKLVRWSITHTITEDGEYLETVRPIIQDYPSSSVLIPVFSPIPMDMERTDGDWGTGYRVIFEYQDYYANYVDPNGDNGSSKTQKFKLAAIIIGSIILVIGMIVLVAILGRIIYLKAHQRRLNKCKITNNKNHHRNSVEFNPPSLSTSTTFHPDRYLDNDQFNQKEGYTPLR